MYNFRTLRISSWSSHDLLIALHCHVVGICVATVISTWTMLHVRCDTLCRLGYWAVFVRNQHRLEIQDLFS